MRHWVFTTKPSHFRMSEALVPGDILDWPTFSRFKFEVGDLVFFYASSPILQMIGKLEIEKIGLAFNEINPRNDLRKWPRHHSSIPWMRLRVLQCAPIPFKALQRGSLYYHTEFKPSPYPKLLHEREINYVLRAFDDAMTFTVDLLEHPDGLNPAALRRVTRGEILKEVVEHLNGAIVTQLMFEPENNLLKLSLRLSTNDAAEQIMLSFRGIFSFNCHYEHISHNLTGIRLTIENTYLKTNIDGADIEILSDSLLID